MTWGRYKETVVDPIFMRPQRLTFWASLYVSNICLDKRSPQESLFVKESVKQYVFVLTHTGSGVG